MKLLRRFSWIALALTFANCAMASQYDESGLMSIAKAAISAEVLHDTSPKISHKQPVRPVFITIELNGQIRGCRGSLIARTHSLEEEIMLSARAAAAHDPRYRPLTKTELKNIKVTVTIVESKSLICDVRVIEPADGLALESGSRWGIVLPWEGKDPQMRLKWAYQKAGVPAGSAANLYRLIATRF